MKFSVASAVKLARKSAYAASALAVLALLAPVGSAQAETSFTLRNQGHAYRQNRPGYSRLHKSDLIATRKFVDPSLGLRAQGEPFDNGFFFETPRGPFGGYTPYMH
jgi:hypothetical protein